MQRWYAVHRSIAEQGQHGAKPAIQRTGSGSRYTEGQHSTGHDSGTMAERNESGRYSGADSECINTRAVQTQKERTHDSQREQRQSTAHRSNGIKSKGIETIPLFSYPYTKASRLYTTPTPGFGGGLRIAV